MTTENDVSALSSLIAINATAKARKLAENPKHYVVFDDSVIELNGAKLQMNKEAWNEISSVLGTTNGIAHAKTYFILFREWQRREKAEKKALADKAKQTQAIKA